MIIVLDSELNYEYTDFTKMCFYVCIVYTISILFSILRVVLDNKLDLVCS